MDGFLVAAAPDVALGQWVIPWRNPEDTTTLYEVAMNLRFISTGILATPESYRSRYSTLPNDPPKGTPIALFPGLASAYFIAKSDQATPSTDLMATLRSIGYVWGDGDELVVCWVSLPQGYEDKMVPAQEGLDLTPGAWCLWPRALCGAYTTAGLNGSPDGLDSSRTHNIVPPPSPALLNTEDDMRSLLDRSYRYIDAVVRDRDRARESEKSSAVTQTTASNASVLPAYSGNPYFSSTQNYLYPSPPGLSPDSSGQSYQSYVLPQNLVKSPLATSSPTVPTTLNPAPRSPTLLETLLLLPPLTDALPPPDPNASLWMTTPTEFGNSGDYSLLDDSLLPFLPADFTAGFEPSLEHHNLAGSSYDGFAGPNQANASSVNASEAVPLETLSLSPPMESSDSHDPDGFGLVALPRSISSSSSLTVPNSPGFRSQYNQASDPRVTLLQKIRDIKLHGTLSASSSPLQEEQTHVIPGENAHGGQVSMGEASLQPSSAPTERKCWLRVSSIYPVTGLLYDITYHPRNSDVLPLPLGYDPNFSDILSNKLPPSGPTAEILAELQRPRFVLSIPTPVSPGGEMAESDNEATISKLLPLLGPASVAGASWPGDRLVRPRMFSASPLSHATAHRVLQDVLGSPAELGALLPGVWYHERFTCSTRANHCFP